MNYMVYIYFSYPHGLHTDEVTYVVHNSEKLQVLSRIPKQSVIRDTDVYFVPGDT